MKSISLTALLLLCSAVVPTPAHAAPIQMSEILHTPAGRWMVAKLGLGELAGLAGSERELFQLNFRTIEARYRRTIPREDLAFTRGSARELSRAQRLVIEAIAREELAFPIPFMKYDSAYAGNATSSRRFSEGTSVQVVGRIRGQHGHTCHLLRRISGTPWESSALFRQTPLTPQGNPGWFVMAEKDLAEFLGLRVVSGDLMIVPGPRELNAAIGKLNTQLTRMGRETIPLHYVPMDNAATSREYAISLIENRMPMARDGHMRVHDTAYHTGSLLLTREMLAPVQSEGRFLRAFEDFVRTDYPGLLEQPEVSRKFDAAWNAVAARFDTGTGVYGGVAHYHHLMGSTSPADAMQEHAMERLLRRALSQLGPAPGSHSLEGVLKEPLERFLRGRGRELYVIYPERILASALGELKSRITTLAEAARAITPAR